MSPLRSSTYIAKRRSHGFGLLETIVAMTLLATTGGVIFAWVNFNLQSLNRLEQAQEDAQLKLDGLQLLTQINPSITKKGSIQSGNLILEYSAVKLESMSRNATFSPPEQGPWQIELYTVELSARRVDSERTVVWQQSLLGQIRILGEESKV
jgi:hypothetical protein